MSLLDDKYLRFYVHCTAFLLCEIRDALEICQVAVTRKPLVYWVVASSKKIFSAAVIEMNKLD